MFSAGTKNMRHMVLFHLTHHRTTGTGSPLSPDSERQSHKSYSASRCTSRFQMQSVYINGLFPRTVPVPTQTAFTRVPVCSTHGGSRGGGGGGGVLQVPLLSRNSSYHKHSKQPAYTQHSASKSLIRVPPPLRMRSSHNNLSKHPPPFTKKLD